jgi:hypothetical protein
MPTNLVGVVLLVGMLGLSSARLLNGVHEAGFTLAAIGNTNVKKRSMRCKFATVESSNCCERETVVEVSLEHDFSGKPLNTGLVFRASKPWPEMCVGKSSLPTWTATQILGGSSGESAYIGRAA